MLAYAKHNYYVMLKTIILIATCRILPSKAEKSPCLYGFFFCIGVFRVKKKRLIKNL